MFTLDLMTTVPSLAVPLPFSNGGCDTMGSVIDSLVRLQHVCEKMFVNISRQVSAGRERYDGLNERILAAAARVDDLKGRKQGMVVFSKPNFPNDVKRSKPIAQMSEDLVKKLKKHRVHLVKPLQIKKEESDNEEAEGAENGEGRPSEKKSITRLEGRGEQVRPLKPQDPTDVFEFNLLVPQEHTRRYHQAVERGLGKLPRQLPSVTSLLLFTTTENLYREYHDVNLFAQQRTERVISNKKNLGLYANIHQDFMTKFSADDYQFVREMDDVANLMEDLPEDLPLEDIAQLDWGGYELQEGDTIAPSGRKKADGDLPSVSESAGIRPSKAKPQAKPLQITAGPITLPSVAGAPPPPPMKAPPPPGKVPPPPPNTVGAKLPPPPPMGGPTGNIPPPPLPKKAPPPPMGGPTPTPGKGNLPPPTPPTGIPPPPPPPVARPPPAKVAPKPAPPPKTDPNADKNANAFKEKLAMRRKGLTGAHSDDEEEEGDTKKKGASSAPPPKAAPPPPKAAPPPPKAAPPPPAPKVPPPKPGGIPTKKKEEEDW